MKNLIILFFLFSFFFSIRTAAQSHNNIEFIENKGQWDSRVQYRGDVSNGAIFIRQHGYTVVQYNAADLANAMQLLHQNGPDYKSDKLNVRTQAFTVDFVDAANDSRAVPDKIIPTYNNYFFGNDRNKWNGGCRIFQAVTLENVYPHIDVRYYTENNFLKYDIVVKPGGDISKIGLRYVGVDGLKIKNRELAISTSLGELKESAPFTYQPSDNGRQEIQSKYVLKDNVIRFSVKNYDPAQTLIIDPTIVFCSFSGSAGDNWGYTATYGPDGSMYGGGINLTTGYPVSNGAFQTNFGGGEFDMSIIKLSPDGSNRIYATYIGGGGNEQPHSLIVDPQGDLIVAGRTNSPVSGPGSYPLVGAAGITENLGGYDIVVTKLNAAGSALIGSKRIGGTADDGVNITVVRGGSNSLQQNYGDDGRSEVNLDAGGNIYLASCTQSTNSTAANNFPVTANAFQKTPGGAQDGVVLKFTPDLSTVLFSSYLGGLANDVAYVINVASNGNIYVAGGTESTNFPGDKTGVIGPNNNGGIDGFVAVISNDGANLIRSTYIGTGGIDQIFGIQFDNNGFPYIMGQTTGSWQVVNAAYSNPGGKQFIVKLQPDLSTYVYSTCFGTGSARPNISPIAFLVDRCENVYISGWGGFYGSINAYGSAGTAGLPITPNAFKSNTDGKDFYFFVLKKDATGQLFGSFFGEDNIHPGTGCDHVDGGTSRFDRNGIIYQAICGNCNLDPAGRPPYPTTPGAWSTVNNASGAGCNLTLLKIAMNLSGVAAGVKSSINAVPGRTYGCIPLPVNFIDTIANAQTYQWDFGDGSAAVTTTVPNTSHTFSTVGTFTVMLIAIDPNTCNVRDTSYVRIRAGNQQAALAFNNTKLPPCDSFKYQFDNTSVAPPGLPFTNQSFTWDFGDGTPPVKAGLATQFHNFPAAGTYTVKLILTDTAYCNAPDSQVVQISVASLVKAGFTTPPAGCLPYNAVFTNNSVAGQSFNWDFGDGTNSTLPDPTHLYATAGTYTITLIANNPNTCNLADTTSFTITVYDAPTPDFSTTPDPPVDNTPTTFTNFSTPDATRFKWVFGDGDSLQIASRQPVQHQYNSTGTFNACLTAYNNIGCNNTVCKPVKALITAVVDVPNAFTPLSNDVNSVLYVRGFGIGKMLFTIYNRWGQKVFETADRNQGWDGKFKGTVQPMDVYVYTLSVDFTDGTKTSKKGDITLIR